MAIESTTIVTLYDDAAKTKAFAPRTKVSAISNDSGTSLQTLLDGKLALAGGTMTGYITFAGGTTQATIKGLKWNSISSKNPYIGYATDQTDGTFIVSSLLGTNYASGLAIDGGSGNLLYKGAVVLHADNWSNYAAAASHNHSAANITSGTLPIGRGGTGAADAINARNNLLYIGQNPITSTTNDTTANWGAYGPGTIGFYSATGQLTDQPSQWGLILTLSAGIGSEIHQIWTTQASGNLLHRGGNGSGWSGSWRTILDSSNYSSYCAPASHSHSYISTGRAIEMNVANGTAWTSATGMSGKTHMGGWHAALSSGTAGYISIGASGSQTMDLFVDGDLWAWENYRMPCIHIQSGTPTAKGKGDIWFVT